jgi:hypothetical protein
MAAVSVYTARCAREGKWWVVTVPELDRVTQARRLEQVEDMVRSLIGLFTDDNPAQAEVRLDVAVPEDVRRALHDAAALRATAEQAQAQAMAQRAAAAGRLVQEGYTVRDVGAVLGVSFQRAQQLVAGR